jgi:hypothetical protein
MDPHLTPYPMTLSLPLVRPAAGLRLRRMEFPLLQSVFLLLRCVAVATGKPFVAFQATQVPALRGRGEGDDAPASVAISNQRSVRHHSLGMQKEEKRPLPWEGAERVLGAPIVALGSGTSNIQHAIGEALLRRAYADSAVRGPGGGKKNSVCWC